MVSITTQVYFLVLVVNVYSHVDLEAIDKKVDRLLKRIEHLEAEDVIHRAKIVAMEKEFGVREQKLQTEIAQLRRKYDDTMAADKTNHEKSTEGQQPVKHSYQRAVAQTQVAFYAIAPDYDLSAMGVGQRILYDAPFTNLGNAFHNSTGTFIAPVRGTYVICVTVGGNIHNSNYFYIDVSGRMMAKALLGTVPNQSSQVVIVTLKPGDTVSVKSGREHAGVYGGYYTTIAGFLLYENNPSIVGK